MNRENVPVQEEMVRLEIGLQVQNEWEKLIYGDIVSFKKDDD